MSSVNSSSAFFKSERVMSDRDLVLASWISNDDTRSHFTFWKTPAFFHVEQLWSCHFTEAKPPSQCVPLCSCLCVNISSFSIRMHTRVYIVLHLIILHTHLAGLPAEFAIAAWLFCIQSALQFPLCFFHLNTKQFKPNQKPPINCILTHLVSFMWHLIDLFYRIKKSTRVEG